jgi:hypothetical protein
MPLEKSSPEMLEKFFRSITHQAFGQLGMRDRQIADYVAALLTEFSRADRWQWLREAEGRRLSNAAEMMVATLPDEGRTRAIGERMIRKHVGDYTLFMSGLFRGYVERGGYLGVYLEEGKRSYRAVSRLDSAVYRPGYMIFEELSERFENYAGALDFMRKCHFAPAAGSSPVAGFLREIDGLIRTRYSGN